MRVKIPTVLFNDKPSVEECTWKMCSIAPVIPAMMPEPLKTRTSLLAPTSELESLPKASIRHGNWLDVASVKKLCAANKIAKPARGSGKVLPNGNRTILKRDWLRVLIAGFFPDMPQEDVQKLMAKLMGTWDPTRLACPKDVMDCVEGLDKEEQDQSFVKRVRELARKARDDAAEVQGRGALPARFAQCYYILHSLSPLCFCFGS